jgi:hypothetical protein
MAIVLGDQLSYGGAKSNFERDMFETIADMKAFSTRKLPAMFITTCVEDGKIYLYNKNNENDDTYGKWRPVESDSAPTGASIETYTTMAEMKEATVEEDSAIAFCTEAEYIGLYAYNSSNENDETTGRWRKVLTNDDVVPAPEGDPNDIMYYGNALSIVDPENIPVDGNYTNWNDIFVNSLIENSSTKSVNKLMEDFPVEINIEPSTAVNNLIEFFIAIPTKFNVTQTDIEGPYGPFTVGDFASPIIRTINDVEYKIYYMDIIEGLNSNYPITVNF